MDSSLTECLKNLADTRHHIKLLNLEENLLRITSDELPSESIRRLRDHLDLRPGVKREFNYRSLIVSIYGALEQYLDAVIEEYIESLNHVCPTYESCPEPIKKHHVELSMDLILRVKHQSYQGTDSVPQIVSRLHSCLSSPVTYSLNSTAFTNRRANYRQGVISTTFAKVGVLQILNRVRETNNFHETIKELFPERNLSELDTEDVFKKIDDLAERRNDVAHGNSGDVLSHELLIPYIDIIEATVKSIREVMWFSLLPYYAKHHGSAETQAIVIYNNEIVCLPVNGFCVSKGDILIGRNEDQSRYIGGRITEIEVNHIKCDQINALESEIDVGLKVDFYAKENYKYCVIDASRL